MKFLFRSQHVLFPEIKIPYDPSEEVGLMAADFDFARKKAGPVLLELLETLPSEITRHPHFRILSVHQDYRVPKPAGTKISDHFHVDTLLSFDELSFSPAEEIERILNEGSTDQFGVCSWGDCVHTQYVPDDLEFRLLDYPGKEWIPTNVERATAMRATEVTDLSNATPIHYTGIFIHRRGDVVHTHGIRYLAVWEVRADWTPARNEFTPFRIDL